MAYQLLIPEKKGAFHEFDVWVAQIQTSLGDDSRAERFMLG